ncbi:hypothetical protein D9M71_739430 [compost metagenome]
MIMRASEDFIQWDSFKGKLSQLLLSIQEEDFVRIRQLLCEMVVGYSPEGEIVDWIYRAGNARKQS